MMIGFLDSKTGGIPYVKRDDTVGLFTFSEKADNLFTRDLSDNHDDLGEDIAPGSPNKCGIPVVALAMTGRGRSFGTDFGFVTKSPPAAGVLTRSCTVRAFLTYEIASHINGQIGQIVAKGAQASTAPTRILYSLKIERVNSTTLRVYADWQEEDGTPSGTAGVTFQAKASGEFFEMAFVRRWNGSADVDVDYFLNGDLIGTENVATGDLGGGVSGFLTVGCIDSGAATYVEHLPDGSIIDSLSIESDEMAPEEIRQDYRRITVHQPAGRILIRAYQPPGRAMSQDPDSTTQRWLAAEGNALGFALAKAEQLREDFFPSRAYGAVLEAWERITRIIPGPTALIAARRSKLVDFLLRILGYQIDDVKLQLESPFGLASAAIEIIEFDGLRSDDFSVDDITTPPSSIWRTIIGGAGGVSVVPASFYCQADAPAAADLRLPVLGGDPNYRETSLSNALLDPPDGAVITSGFDSVLAPDADTIAGFLWRTSDEKNALVVGVSDSGGTMSVAYLSIVNGQEASIVHLATPGAGALDPSFLISRYLGNGSFVIGYGALADGPFTTFQIDNLFEPSWVGFGVFGDDASASGTISARWDNLRIFEPRSTRGNNWYAYRDPGLGGTYDLGQAQDQVSSIKPAHTHGAAIELKAGFGLGPTGSGRLGLDPLFPSGV